MNDNDTGTTEEVVEDNLPLEPTPEVAADQQTEDDIGIGMPVKPVDDTKPGEETKPGGGEDDPDNILIPKEPEAAAKAKEDEKTEPKKGSAEWYEKRLAHKDKHINDLETDNYAYRVERRETKLDSSRRQHEAKLTQLDDFKVLSDQEETELIEENPGKYKEYVKQIAEYERLKGQVGKENGRFTPEEHETFQLEEYNEFLKKAFGFDYAVEAKKDRAAADKRYEELNVMPEVNEMAEALKGYQPGKSGLHTAKQMHLLYKGVTKDQAVKTATITARKNLTNEINTNQERVGFDVLPKAPEPTVPIKVDDLSPEEIGNMDAGQLKTANEAIQAEIKRQDLKARGVKTKGR